MIRKNLNGHLPKIYESAYVDQTAILCGKVIAHENVFICPYAVIRTKNTQN